MKKTIAAIALSTALACVGPVALAGCGSFASGTTSSADVTAADSATASTPAAGQTDDGAPATIADGTYPIHATTDSSMFRADSCELIVAGGTYKAVLTLPGEGFSRLYFGSAEEAAQASDDAIYDYELNDQGKYTFTVPVSALDEELSIAAFGHRRNKWYDHTIVFHAPGSPSSSS